MHGTEQRRLAIETFIRFDHSYADTIAELGHPTRTCLRNWWREYRETGEVPVGKMIREPRFSDDQKREAVEHYLSHGKSLSRTMRALGCPKSRMTLCDWIDELAPGQRKHRGPNQKRDPSHREEGAGHGRAGGEGGARRADRREARRVAHGALRMAQGDNGR